MGAKDCFILYADGDVPALLASRPALDRPATEELVRRLFPDRLVTAIDDGTIGDDANPEDGTVYAAVWPGATIVCTSAVALDRPSQVDPRFLAEGRGRTVYVHAMHSVVDWFALGVWTPDGRLRRALSVSGGDGEVLEDLGEPLPFEEPFWAGGYPATEDEDDDYPFPFHPLELAEAALDQLFGFVFEGYSGMGPETVDPLDLTLAGFGLAASPERRRLFGRR
ncbi:MAG TPA: hypothetical protein VN088_06495 [Nocardioides sp.]|nr:hypothetical protein [Nocardioides sp.]